MADEILLVIPGAEGGSSTGRPAIIEPETTVADLLRAAGMPPTEWQLQIKQGEDYTSLQSQERLSDHVEAGEKVYAFPTKMVVGLES